MDKSKVSSINQFLNKTFTTIRNQNLCEQNVKNLASILRHLNNQIRFNFHKYSPLVLQTISEIYNLIDQIMTNKLLDKHRVYLSEYCNFFLQIMNKTINTDNLSFQWQLLSGWHYVVQFTSPLFNTEDEYNTICSKIVFFLREASHIQTQIQLLPILVAYLNYYPESKKSKINSLLIGDKYNEAKGFLAVIEKFESDEVLNFLHNFNHSFNDDLHIGSISVEEISFNVKHEVETKENVQYSGYLHFNFKCKILTVRSEFLSELMDIEASSLDVPFYTIKNIEVQRGLLKNESRYKMHINISQLLREFVCITEENTTNFAHVLFKKMWKIIKEERECRIKKSEQQCIRTTIQHRNLNSDKENEDIVELLGSSHNETPQSIQKHDDILPRSLMSDSVSIGNLTQTVVNHVPLSTEIFLSEPSNSETSKLLIVGCTKSVTIPKTSKELEEKSLDFDAEITQRNCGAEHTYQKSAEMEKSTNSDVNRNLDKCYAIDLENKSDNIDKVQQCSDSSLFKSSVQEKPNNVRKYRKLYCKGNSPLNNDSVCSQDTQIMRNNYTAKKRELAAKSRSNKIMPINDFVPSDIVDNLKENEQIPENVWQFAQQLTVNEKGFCNIRQKIEEHQLAEDNSNKANLTRNPMKNRQKRKCLNGPKSKENTRKKSKMEKIIECIPLSINESINEQIQRNGKDADDIQMQMFDDSDDNQNNNDLSNIISKSIDRLQSPINKNQLNANIFEDNAVIIDTDNLSYSLSNQNLKDVPDKSVDSVKTAMLNQSFVTDTLKFLITSTNDILQNNDKKHKVLQEIFETAKQSLRNALDEEFSSKLKLLIQNAKQEFSSMIKGI